MQQTAYSIEAVPFRPLNLAGQRGKVDKPVIVAETHFHGGVHRFKTYAEIEEAPRMGAGEARSKTEISRARPLHSTRSSQQCLTPWISERRAGAFGDGVLVASLRT